MKKILRVKIPATSANLGPGFDCLGAALTLYNTIRVELLQTSGQPKIVVKGCHQGIIPENGSNLVYRTIRKVFEENRKMCPPLSVEINIAIPIGKGLGSSASAIVGALLAANELLHKKYTVDDLIGKAVQIEGHPDNVVPAFMGGLCVTRAENDSVPWWKTNIASDLCACVCVPEFSVLTKKARKLMPQKYSRTTSIYTTSGAAFFVSAVTAPVSPMRNRIIHEAMKDKFHQPYRRSLVSGMDTVFTAAVQAGALGAALSGSGPSIIALVEKRRNVDRVGNAMVTAFNRCSIKSDYMILNFDTKGAHII